MNDEQITVEHDPQRHRYEIRVDGEVAGHTSYQLHGSTVALMHTEIDDRFEGRGLGTRLVADVLADLQKRGGMLLPYCPFVRAFLADHPQYVAIVPPEDRERFGLESPRS